MIEDTTEKLNETRRLLKSRIYTDFCNRCPNARKAWDGYCAYIKQTAWDCVFDGKDMEQEVNEFTCFYNIERLTLTKE